MSGRVGLKQPESTVTAAFKRSALSTGEHSGSETGILSYIIASSATNLHASYGLVSVARGSAFSVSVSLNSSS
jgi:hypothetical protein